MIVSDILLTPLNFLGNCSQKFPIRPNVQLIVLTPNPSLIRLPRIHKLSDLVWAGIDPP